MTRPTSSPAPQRRNVLLVAGVVALAVVVTLLAVLVLGREPRTAGSGAPSAPVSVPPSASPMPSDVPTDEPAPSQPAAPTESPVEAPDEWILVHEFGGEGDRWVGAEIAYGDAGFLAIGRRWDGGEGGPRIAETGMWISADGREWDQVECPAPASGSYFVMALSGADDGSYVLHVQSDAQDGNLATTVTLRSTDGRTWEPIDTGLAERIHVQVIAEGPNGYLLVGGQTGYANPSLWLSADGLTWEQVHEFAQDTEFVQIQDADGGEDGYVVIGRRIAPDGGPYQRFSFASADGRSWVEQSEPFGPDDQDFVFEVAVSSLGPDWVATLAQRDYTTTTFTSSDGLTWSEAGTIPLANENVADAGLLEEIGDELLSSPGGGLWFEGMPGVFASADGATWSPVDMSADAWLAKLAIGDGVVAVTGTIPGAESTTSGGIWIRDTD